MAISDIDPALLFHDLERQHFPDIAPGLPPEKLYLSILTIGNVATIVVLDHIDRASSLSDAAYEYTESVMDTAALTTAELVLRALGCELSEEQKNELKKRALDDASRAVNELPRD